MKKILLLFFLLLNFGYGFTQTHRDSVDVCHYKLFLNMMNAPNGFISGEASLSIKFNFSADNFALDLYQLITDSVKVNNTLVSFSSTDSLVRINTNVNSSDTFLVSIFYSGQPKADKSWGGFFYDGTVAYNIGVGMSSYPHGIGRFWYPCIDSFTDRATYEYEIKTTKLQKAVAGGLLVNEKQFADYNIFYWQLNEPIPTYLSSVAVGPFIVINDIYNGIERNIPIQIYAVRSDSSASLQTFSKLKETLAVFETKFGPYFWPRVGYVVVPFTSGAMEHATNIAYPRNQLGNNLGAFNLVAHELAHHWFGNLVTCSTSTDMWLNEGWASYCETIFKEGVYGYEKGESHTLNNQIGVIKAAHKVDNGYFALNDIPKEITYGATVYNKGALVTHCLRTYLGDEKFFSGVTEFLKQNKFTGISSGYLQQQLSNITGIDLEPFFNNWVYLPGFPHYSVGNFMVSKSGNEFNVAVQMKQKLKARNAFSLNNKVELTFIDNNYNRLDTVIIFSGETEVINFVLPFEPVAIFTDLHNQVLDPITTNMHYISQTGYTNFTNCEFKLNTQSISDSALVRVQYNWLKADDIAELTYGLHMSNYHYWKVEGVFPESFKSDGKFSYNFSQNTNGTDQYQIGSTDTVVLVYRKDNTQSWRAIQKIEAAKIVTSYTWIEDIKPGEYALAIWDGLSPIGMNTNFQKTTEPILYPNPMQNYFAIKMPNFFSGMIEVRGIHGNKYLEKEIENQEEIVIMTNNLPKGVYFVKSIGTINATFKAIKE